MDLEKEQAIIEALLFVSGCPLELKEITKVIEKDEPKTLSLINDLIKKYENRGLKIIQINNSFQICTNPKYNTYIKKLYEIPKKKSLSQATLETLSIIAYKQPITKLEIQEIRGVNSDYCVNTLIKYNLIEEKGRLDAPGKPILLGTTLEFLRYFDFQQNEDFHKLIQKNNISSED